MYLKQELILSSSPDIVDNQREASECQDTDDTYCLISARSLKCQCAMQCVLHNSRLQITQQKLPHSLYPTLLGEACRVGNTDMVCYLVSNWPYSLLNLHTLEVPLDAMGGYFTKVWGKDNMSLATMVIKGLLELEPTSQLKCVVLPHSECEGSEILRLFCRLPLLLMRPMHRKHIAEKICKVLGSDCINASSYLQSLPNLPFETNCKIRNRKEPIVISLPGVIQWIGRHCNYRDVLVGLALQAYVPVQLTFEKLLIYNAHDLSLVNRILELCAQPEKTKKLIINNRKCTETVHVLLKVGALQQGLSRFTGLESFLVKFDGSYMASPVGNLSSALECSARCFAQWKYLLDLNLSGNLMALNLGKLLGGLETPLVKLNLSATGLCEADFQFLAQSKHTQTLQYLNIDHNDLSPVTTQDAVRTMFSSMKSLVYLRTCSTRLTHAVAVKYAASLQHLTTLQHWSLLQSNFGRFDELVRFIEACAGITSLRKLGCKPFELHALFTNMYIQSVGPPALSDSERIELATFAERYGIAVY